MSEVKECTVISFGGSLVYPEAGYDTAFISDWIQTLRRHTESGRRFVLVVGGGVIAREAMGKAERAAERELSSVELDWIGIRATRLNAEVVRAAAGDIAGAQVITTYEELRKSENPIMVMGGMQPGQSTDAVAVEAARVLGVRQVVNMSSAEAVYSADPKLNPEAERLTTISWSEYLALIPHDWQPGLSTPFDPVAARKAAEAEIEVVIVGKERKNAKRVLLGEEFDGTTIHP